LLLTYKEHSCTNISAFADVFITFFGGIDKQKDSAELVDKIIAKIAKSLELVGNTNKSHYLSELCTLLRIGKRTFGTCKNCVSFFTVDSILFFGFSYDTVFKPNEDMIDMEKAMLSVFSSYLNYKSHGVCLNCGSMDEDTENVIEEIKIPPVLIFRLSKRGDEKKEETKQNIKHKDSVSYLDKFDMSKILNRSISGDVSYVLKSVLIHKYLGPNLWHFYVFMRDINADNMWYKLNDTSVQKLDDKYQICPLNKLDTGRETPLLFIYTKQSPRAITLNFK
jgi:hypothetical protein